MMFFFFFSSRRRHTRSYGDWSSDVCSSDLRAREIKRSLSAIERRGAEGAVDRCRALADRIRRNLRNKKLFGNNLSLLAELQVSIERAASVLDRIAALNHDQKGTLRKMNG